MSPMKLFATVVVATAAFGLIPMAWADDPSLHEVYQAVHEGRLNDAQSMMTKVLHDHPDSAKAHYVEAEVLAHLQRSDDAEAELEHADRLAPGLPFAKPEAVRDLRGLIAERGRGRVVGVDRAAGSMGDVRTAESAFPWGAVLIVLGAGLVLFLFLRARRSAVVPMSGAGSAIGPAGSAYGVSPYGAAPMGGGGIGSSIVGGLATGAAVGAGMVAGEALAHEFIGNHDRDRSGSDAGWGDGSRVADNDGGGRDFGVSDSDSWDSGSNDIAGGDGGGGDWG
ncbi:conserved membrane hypothetical protein [Burkholderiales bacterium]|nr:conserved membrane hypothetical protein [Burkholderiales bacterium]